MQLLLHRSYDPADVVVMTGVVVGILIVVGIAMRSKYGSLVMAMTGAEAFMHNRHHHSGAVTVALLVIGNAIVAVAGGLYAWRDGAGHVMGHVEFLPVALGAVFGGNAVTFLGAAAYRYLANQSRLQDARSVEATQERFVRTLQRAFQSRTDDAQLLPWLLAVSFAGCAVLHVAVSLIQANALEVVAPALAIMRDPYQYVFAAMCIVAFGGLVAADRD
jgi:hypothetical protein